MSRMRLICPNCAAQYEVPIDVIPKGGRDVQCSNCGQTWYQAHPDDAPPVDDTPPDPVPPAGDDPQVAAARTRSIDPEMAELFREERDFESRQRAAEALESQPDLGLPPPAEDERTRRARQARERMARMRGEDHAEQPVVSPAPSRPVAESYNAEAAAAAAAANSRRDLLPDVEEINQSLRATSEPRVVDTARGDPVPTETSKSGGGFAKGFFLIVLLAAIAIGVYAAAPQIKEAVPAAAPYLDSYVAFMDQARLWLDGQVTSLFQTLDAMSSEAADPATTDPAPADPDAAAPAADDGS